MPEGKMDGTTKFAAWVIGIIVAVLVGIVGLFGWAVIELIQWITSK